VNAFRSRGKLGPPVPIDTVAATSEHRSRPRLAALAVELFRFRELLALLVARDLKVRYKRSVLGMFWTLLNPLLQMGVYTLVFSVIMRIDVERYPVFLLSGLLPWSLVSVGVSAASQSLLGNQGLIRKVAVPQAVYPLAVIGSKATDLVLSLPALALLSTALGRPPGVSWLFLPVAVLIAASFAAGLALLLASVTVFFRDMRHLVDLLFQVWFYLTPVFYPASFFEKVGLRPLRLALAANPAAPIVRLFQEAVYEARLPAASTIAAAALVAVVSLAFGASVFARCEDRHIHYF
jgi:lipopolysaccharide transport system permease protein